MNVDVTVNSVREIESGTNMHGVVSSNEGLSYNEASNAVYYSLDQEGYFVNSIFLTYKDENAYLFEAIVKNKHYDDMMNEIFVKTRR